MQKSRKLVLSRALPGADDKVGSKHRVAAGRVVKVYIPLPWPTFINVNNCVKRVNDRDVLDTYRAPRARRCVRYKHWRTDCDIVAQYLKPMWDMGILRHNFLELFRKRFAYVSSRPIVSDVKSRYLMRISAPPVQTPSYFRLCSSMSSEQDMLP
jgi:hypothetical protein